jgi:hypothetical protein
MGDFAFEDCLLKHYIRREVWLPHCKAQLKHIRDSNKAKEPRRLRYFTFCAVGALDVLMLDRAKVIRTSSSTGLFDTVYFFDRDNQAIVETQKRIPGANGFPGDFVDVVLQAQDGAALDLHIPTDAPDTRETRQKQMRKAQLDSFMSAFPFDVINLDVEQYLFRPSEELPGKLANAMRKIFEWQRRQGMGSNGRDFTLSEFTLMFTTKVGPAGLPDNYIKYLRDDCLQANINTYGELEEPFQKKSSGKSVADFFNEDFDAAFKLAVPKSLSELAYEQDWYIDDKNGIQVFQFDRSHDEGDYRMLHMSMTVKRHAPPKEQRGPGQSSTAAHDSHKKMLQKLFTQDVIAVDAIVKGNVEKELRADLKKLIGYRKKYYDSDQ